MKTDDFYDQRKQEDKECKCDIMNRMCDYCLDKLIVRLS